MPVRIHQLEPLESRGAHVVAAFPSIGLVATIAANFLIERLGLRQVGVMDGPDFPTLAVVQAGEPLGPVRIYAGEYASREGKTRPLVVFLSEFQPNPDLVRPVAEAILDWCREQGAELIVSPEGLVVEGAAAEDNIVEVYAIASRETTRRALADAGVPLFHEGIVAGVTGVLLNLGRREDFDVVGILSEAKREYPDARSAATVVELMAEMVGASLSADALFDEADAFERQVADTLRRRRMHQETLEKSGRPSMMYG